MMLIKMKKGICSTGWCWNIFKKKYGMMLIKIMTRKYWQDNAGILLHLVFSQFCKNYNEVPNDHLIFFLLVPPPLVPNEHLIFFLHLPPPLVPPAPDILMTTWITLTDCHTKVLLPICWMFCHCLWNSSLFFWFV